MAITKNGRNHTVLVSAALFEILTQGRVARKVEDLDQETLEAIRQSAVGPEYEHLDALIEDWNP